MEVVVLVEDVDSDVDPELLVGVSEFEDAVPALLVNVELTEPIRVVDVALEFDVDC